MPRSTPRSRPARPPTTSPNAVAYYTDICGIPLKADGTAALHADGTEDLASGRAGRLGGAAGWHGDDAGLSERCASVPWRA